MQDNTKNRGSDCRTIASTRTGISAAALTGSVWWPAGYAGRYVACGHYEKDQG